VPISSP